jgi:5-methylcytosine-specific restriction endonuclease McrA
MLITKETYKELLKDRRWAKKRLQIFRRDGFKCTRCGDATNIQVHHLHYLRGKPPWEHPNHFMFTLCDRCHELNHEAFGLSYIDNLKKNPKQPPPKKKTKKETPNQVLLRKAAKEAKAWQRRLKKKR